MTEEEITRERAKEIHDILDELGEYLKKEKENNNN